MMISIQRFEPHHVDEAAQLFAANYARLVAANHLLPAQFADPASVAPMLETTVREHPGAVAFTGNQMAGFLTGIAGIPTFFGHADGVYVPVWAHGATAAEESAEVFAALYHKMSAQWAARQCYSQAISYFLDRESQGGALKDLLFGLGFGLRVIDGIRPPSAVDMPEDGAVSDEGIEIRAADASDVAAIQELDHKLFEHLRSAPIFLHTKPVPDAEIERNFLREGARTFLAWQGETAIAGIRGVLDNGPGCELFDVEGSLGVNFGYTDVAARRNGVASRLLNELVRWGASQGMVRCVVDFESANLPARGFWTRHFQPISHSVTRRVDERM